MAVALSGGRDSTALWHATARVARQLGNLEVVGLHVHHGLQPEADAWLERLRRQARRWAARGWPVAFDWRRLEGRPPAGESIEAWARRGRYAALSEMARSAGIDLVLLAHHRRDQAETFLLQALRGAGPAGLAAMPRLAWRNGISWARPWLERPREAIEAYVRHHRLSYVDDASNRDPRHARNALRRDVWPSMVAAFAHVEVTLAASASRAHEAARCLDELARIDLQGVAGGPDGRVHVASWRQLSEARRANLLRAWLGERLAKGAPDSLVERLLDELPGARAGSRWPAGDGELRLHGGTLRFVSTSDDTLRPSPPREIDLDLSRVGRYPLPEWGGAVEVRRATRDGLPVGRLRHCQLRWRSGGEVFQRAPSTPARSLKKQFQAAGVPSWQRHAPLVFEAGELLFVPGLGVDARRIGAPGTPMRTLHWEPDPPGKPWARAGCR